MLTAAWLLGDEAQAKLTPPTELPSNSGGHLTCLEDNLYTYGSSALPLITGK